MRKIFTMLFCLMAIALNVNAQNGWETRQMGADELLGTKATTSYQYGEKDKGFIVFWEDDAKTIRLISPKGELFQTNDTRERIGKKEPCLYAVVGFYDLDGKLTDKGHYCFVSRGREFNFVESATGTALHPKNIGKKVIKYIKEKKGYIRIVAPLYVENKNFDLKIPCMGN